MSKDLFEDRNDGGDVTYAGGGDSTTRQIVVATLGFIELEIKRNLSATDPGVASALAVIEALKQETSKGASPAKPEAVKSAHAPASVNISRFLH